MLYIFSKSDKNAGGSRHRAFLVADFLRSAGHEAELVIPPMYRKDVSRSVARKQYVKTIFSLRKNDIVLLQNPIFNKYFIALICLVKIIFRPTIVFDFDDATWVQNPIAPRVTAFFSDKFIVASHYLAAWPPIAGRPVLVMPNLIDYTIADKYISANRYGSDTSVVLGWIGNAPDSMNNLSLLLPVMKELATRKSPCIFRIIGTLGEKSVIDAFVRTGIKFESIDRLDWGKEGEIQKANGAFDIGLCPLVRNISNEARCSLKVLDYMAAHLPVVASPVGENEHFVQDGVNGFLADSTDEWVAKISQLIVGADMRRHQGLAAYEKLKAEYSYQANIGKYVEFLGLN